MRLLRSLTGVCMSLFAATCFAAATYTYDSLSRITSVDYGNGASISYGYDAAGNMNAALAGSNPPASIFGTGSGPLTARKLSVTVRAASADVGAARQVFVAAIFGQLVYFRTPSGWQAWTGGGFPAYYSGALPAQATIQLLDGSLDVSSLVGVQIYAGYGADASEMLASGRYSLVHIVQ